MGYADESPIKKSGSPIFNVWTPIVVAIVSVLLAMVVIARTL